MISKHNSAQVGDNTVVVDLEYLTAKLDPYDGGSSVTIKVKNRRVDSIVVREYDNHGNMVSTEGFYT